MGLMNDVPGTEDVVSAVLLAMPFAPGEEVTLMAE